MLAYLMILTFFPYTFIWYLFTGAIDGIASINFLQMSFDNKVVPFTNMLNIM